VEPDKQDFEFGPYHIHAAEKVLYRDAEVIPLPPKVVDTLVVLVINAGRMVEKGDLMKAVWPDTFVEEGALARNISLLRKTLGDQSEEAVYIETIPRRGYRFVAPVRIVDRRAPEPPPVPVHPAHSGLVPVGTTSPPSLAIPPEAAPKPRPSNRLMLGFLVALAAALTAGYFAASRVDHRTGSVASNVHHPATVLAVVPFRNDMNDPAQDYVVDGMTQALITSLSKLSHLRVVSMDSGTGSHGETAALDAAAKDSSTNLVLTGTVLRSGEQVRIDAKLLDPRTRQVYWANAYKRDMKDVPVLVSDVAEAIAKEMQVGLTTQETERLHERRQVDPAALDAYWRGRYFWNLRTMAGLKQAIDRFQQAIAVDPLYALAYTGLADSWSLMSSIEIAGETPAVGMPRAKAAAMKALELDPNLADAHVSLAYVKLSYDWDLPGAQKEFARAIELDPASANAHHWYAHYFLAAGDLTRAAAEAHEALLLEPLSPSIAIGPGWCYYYAKEYDKAIEQFRAVVEMNPAFPMAHQTLGMAYQQKGMHAEAIEQLRQAVEISGGNLSTIAGLATAYASAGRVAEARQELAKLEAAAKKGDRYVPALFFGEIHLALGDKTAAIADTWKAVGERSDYLMYLRLEPSAGPIAGNPEFIRLLGKLH
jgi:DNA-binding winged helix-turn-helix (wHTH) protein/TolB-like protein/Tfp pilus assembly protein PilF